MLTLVPVLITYLGLILLSDVDATFVYEHLWVWGAIITYSLLITLVLTSISVSLSSLTTRKFYAAFGLIMTYFLSALIADIITGGFSNDHGSMVSLHTSLHIVGTRIFRVSEITYKYNWEYNLLVLAIIMIVSLLVVSLKIWRTELSE